MAGGKRSRGFSFVYVGSYQHLSKLANLHAWVAPHSLQWWHACWATVTTGMVSIVPPATPGVATGVGARFSMAAILTVRAVNKSAKMVLTLSPGTFSAQSWALSYLRLSTAAHCLVRAAVSIATLVM